MCTVYTPTSIVHPKTKTTDGRPRRHTQDTQNIELCISYPLIRDVITANSH